LESKTFCIITIKVNNRYFLSNSFNILKGVGHKNQRSKKGKCHTGVGVWVWWGMGLEKYPKGLNII
jgi:hypothetical protein